MFAAGEMVVYGGEGVCRVEGVGTPSLPGMDKTRLYYTLAPLYRSGQVMTPVDTRVLMRPLLTGQEVQELIAQGAITPDQARSHPHRNVVTQALGVTDPVQLNVETLSGELRPGMQLLLCSDGLTEEVDDRAIARVLAHDECSAQECVDGLVAAALDGGGSDNVTVVLVRRH